MKIKVTLVCITQKQTLFYYAGRSIRLINYSLFINSKANVFELFILLVVREEFHSQ